MTGPDPDHALRKRVVVNAYLDKRRQLIAVEQEIKAIKSIVRSLADEVGSRLSILEARSTVLSRTVANLLAELDHSHTTSITRIQREHEDASDPNAATQPVDPTSKTPRPG